MNVGEVRRRVAAVAAEAGDPEQAHWEQDRLWEDVLVAIAGGAVFPKVLAEAALSTRSIDFPRWYA